jgi:hypothetical protein
VQRGEERTEFGPEHVLERCAAALYQRHRGAEPAGGRGDLAADPARSDHDEPTAADGLAQPVGIGHGSQHVHALAVGSLDRGTARDGAGRDEQPVVADARAVSERNLSRAGVEGTGAPRDQLDVVLVVVRPIVHLGVGERRLAGEVALRQRRTLVGQLGLVPHQDQAAVETLGAQCLGGLRARHASADDDERVAIRHGVLQSGTGTPGACAGRRAGARGAPT